MIFCKFLIIIFTWIWLQYGKSALAANILAIFPCDSKSHYNMGKIIFEELTMKGHKITVISRYAMETESNENITNIRLEGVKEHLQDIGLAEENYLAMSEKSIIERLTDLIYGTTALVNYTLGYPKVQELILNDDNKFDLLIIDMYFMDSLLGLAHYWKIPAIVLCSVGTNKWTNEMVGNPHSPAYNPSIFLGYTDKMSLKERLINTLASAFEKITYNYMYLPSQEAIYKRYFEHKYNRKNEKLPPLLDLIHNVSLVLVNSHPSIQYPRPYVSNMIQIGGLHLKKSLPPIPQAIADYINAVPDGVIVMCLGSLINTIDLPKEKLNAFLNAFKNYIGKLRIILKYEGAILDDQPDNVAIGPWLPVQEILRHPKVRLLITNGGRFSIMEAISTGTPILGIPIYGDQDHNMAQIEYYGLGKLLDYNNITEESIIYYINEILENPKYQENIKKFQTLLLDNPIDPLENTIYHIEYVLRYNGAHHLRSVSVDLSIWKQYLIDVSLIIIIGISILIAVPSCIICIILRKNNTGKLNNNKNKSNGHNNGNYNIINNKTSMTPTKRKKKL